MSEELKCSQCGGQMVPKKKTERNMGVQVAGVLVFMLGLILCFTGFGAFFGVPLMIGACFMGYKKKKVMACKSCGYFFERV